MTASSFPVANEASNYDEDSIQQSLMFSDSLKDLETLSSQLYSAAEYFELSYNNDDQKHILIETLKDYAIKALVNTVDHLGSATDKVNDLLDEKVGEVSATEFRVSCIEQRLRTCQEYTDREGRTEQSLVISSPKFHKHYILPGNLRATVREARPPPIRKGRSPSPIPSPRTLRRQATFSAPSSTLGKELGNRTVSPRRFPLLRSSSTTSPLVTPRSSRPATPNKNRPNHNKYPLEPRKSTSSENSRDMNQDTSKGKGFLRALFGSRKSKKDEMLYTYLDEY